MSNSTMFGVTHVRFDLPNHKHDFPVRPLNNQMVTRAAFLPKVPFSQKFSW